MEELLTKIGLIDHISFELDIQKSDFVNALSHHVEPSTLGFFSDPFEAFSSSKNQYKGMVNYDGFEIKRRRTFFDRASGYARASGEFYQKNDKLIVNAKINGFSRAILPFYGFVIVFYIFFICMMFLSADGSAAFSTVPFIVLHATLMLGIPVFIMRKSVKKLKYDMERDFYYFTRPFPGRR